MRGDVETVYSAADAFLLPTSYETFSLVTFEAAASGLPLLATAVNGISELIEEGVTTASSSIAATAARSRRGCDELGADPALRKRLGEAARRSASRFSWESTVLAHHELYERLAGA